MKQWISPDIKELDFAYTLGRRRNQFDWSWLFDWFSNCNPTPHHCNPTPTPVTPPSLS